jgi:hypothetical protein
VIVSSLHRYPVKSLRGEPLDRARIEPWGIAGDRRWMVVDRAGEKLWAGRHHQLLTVTARAVTGGVRLEAAGVPGLIVAQPVDGAVVEVRLRGVGTARAAGDPADAWLRDVLGVEARLVWLDDPGRRPMTERHGGLAGDVLSLADAAPLLLTTQPSLRQLDAWISRHPDGAQGVGPLAIERFRPNLVLDGDIPAFAEDGWRDLRIGEVPFRFAEACDRCAVTAVEPGTGRAGKEPVRTLARHRRWDGHVWFGIRVVPVTGGVVALGDAATVLR